MSFLASLVGSFSEGASSNPTIAIMDAAFEHEGLNWRYINCEVAPDGLVNAVSGAWAMGWMGFNCSIPHKQDVIAHMSDLSPTARISHAVNCAVRSDRGWIGHNTDGIGFLASVADVRPIQGVAALILGSGGAAHAVALELAQSGARRIAVTGRNVNSASSLAQLIDNVSPGAAELVEWDDGIRVPDGTELIVNATPIGSTPDVDMAPPIDWTGAEDRCIVADVIVNPTRTRFLREAEDRGLDTIDGTGMLVNQAAENIRLWTGTRPDTAPMRATLDLLL